MRGQKEKNSRCQGIQPNTDKQQLSFFAKVYNMPRIERHTYCRYYFREPDETNGKRIVGKVVYPPAHNGGKHADSEGKSKPAHQQVAIFGNIYGCERIVFRRWFSHAVG